MRRLGFAQGVLLAATLFGAACAEQAFSAHSRDNNEEDIRRALALSKAPSKAPPPGGPMAFVVTSAPDKQIAGLQLPSGNVAWKIPADVRSRIVVGGGLIAHRQGTNEIVARDRATGQPRYSVRIAGDEKLMGLTLDEERLYYVVQSTAAGRRVSYTVAIDRNGHEQWRTPAQGSLGAPAARGGLVAVPFAQQNVSLLDGTTGREVGRVRATDEQISFVRATPEGIFYGGGHGVYLLDEKSVNGSRAGSSYIEATLGSDQIRPVYSWDAYRPEQTDYSALDRNRLLWRAQPAQGQKGVAFEHDTAVLHSYRYLFALDTNTGKLRWAYAHPRIDVVGAEDTGPTILFAAADGDVGALDEATGKPTVFNKTGLRIAGVTFDAESLRVESQSHEETANALRSTLEQIIWDNDSRFMSVKVFATGQLADVPGLETTAALIKLVRAESGMPKQVQKRAGEALLARKDKAADKLLVDALAVHTDWLANKRAVGVDVLAHAAADIGCRAAVPAIAAHLADPETPQAALKDLVAALVTLGGKDAAKALRGFLLGYRADPLFLQDPAALAGAGLGLLAMGPDERRIVSFVAAEHRTLPSLADVLNRALHPQKPAPNASPEPKSAQAK